MTSRQVIPSNGSPRPLPAPGAVDGVPEPRADEQAGVPTPRPLPGDGPATHDAGSPWRQYAEALADWALARVAVRQDVYGTYYEAGGEFRQTTAHAPLTRDVLVRHFRGEIVVGLHSTSPDNRCLGVSFDIDAHDDEADPEQNWRCALKTAELLAGYRLNALVFDSHGKGGYHVRVFFKKPILVAAAWWLCGRIRADLEAAGFPPIETFPKQGEVTLARPYGNWIRLPGKHHKRGHWTRIAGSAPGEWLEGEAAARRLIAVAGDDPGKVLDAFKEAQAGAAAPACSGARTSTPLSRPGRGDRKADAATVREALDFLPVAMADSYGGSRADTGWLGVGMALHDWDPDRGLDLWEEFSRRSAKYEPGACAAKWTTFTAGGGLSVGTIFHEAEANGWDPPWRQARTTPSANGRARAKANGRPTTGPDAAPIDVDAIIETAKTFKSDSDVLFNHEFLSACARLDRVDLDKVDAALKEKKIGIRAFHRAVDAERPEPSGGALDSSFGLAGYNEIRGCLSRIREDGEGDNFLSNFTARIVTQIERHEAGEVRRLFEIKATHEDGRHATVVVPAAKYNAMDWVPDQLGAEFVILAGRSVKDDVRAAIQLFSDRDGIARSVVHTSLGWIEHDGEPIYLHSRGCISREGPSGAVMVETAPALAPYFLPDPPTTRGGIAEAVDSVFRLLDVGNQRCPIARQCSAVLMSLPWRALLGPFNSSVHFSGPSGTRKTSAARLALGFFAAGAGARGGQVSVSWDATLNALQRYSFDCRDSVLVVDELTDAKAVATATAFFQNQGNLMSRARMNKDLSLAPSLNPRGAVVSTGEADPLRRSALGRMLTIKFTRETLDGDEALGRCQKDSEDGLHVRATAAYIRWLAEPGRLESMRARLRGRAREIDPELRTDPRAKDVHARQPEAIAELIAAFEIFTDFAVEDAGVARSTADAYLGMVKDGLIGLLHSQADQHQEADPARRFLAMLAAGLSSLRFHLEGVDNDLAPEPYASALGWTKKEVFLGKEVGRGLDWTIPSGSTRLGYVDVTKRVAYLDPEICKALAQTMGRDMGQAYECTGNIARDLHEAGALVVSEKEEGRKVRLTPTKRIRGAVKRYLCLHLDHLVGEADHGDGEQGTPQGVPF